MTLKLRRMRGYHPRKKRAVTKQQLHDLHHPFHRHVSTLLLLIKEGNSEQINQAHLNAKTAFLKAAPEMQRVAKKLGTLWVEKVGSYLKSVDRLVHSNLISIDPATISHYYTANQLLEKEMQAA